jgi:hypothetical protein
VNFQVACLFLFGEGGRGITFWETCENTSLLLSNPGRRFVSPLLECGLQVGGGWKRPHKYEDNDDLPVVSSTSGHLARPGHRPHVVFSTSSFLLCPGTKDAHRASHVLASPYSLQFSILCLSYTLFSLSARLDQSFHYLGPRFSQLLNSCSVSHRI